MFQQTRVTDSKRLRVLAARGFFRVALLLAFLAGTVRFAYAQLLIPTGQDRSVHASASGPEGSDSRDAAATDYGPFDQGVSVHLGPVSVGAGLDSEINVASIAAVGGSGANMLSGPDPEYSGQANAVCNVSFELPRPAAFVFSGEVLASMFASAHVAMDQYGGSSTGGAIVPFSAWGMLPPGSHELSAHAQSMTAGGPFFVEAHFTFQLALFFPGDLDGDCAVGLPDLALLLSHFGTPTGATYADGDVDGDADVDLSDLAILLTHYGGTC
jgi:hypothetical protein